jgi:hypothetical protein
MRIWVVVALAVAFLVGCSSNETNDKEKRGSTSEETRFVTQLVTVEQTVEETTSVVGGPCVTQEQSPEDVLALQYEYINSGDFEEAYALFAEQSRREVSLAQYRAFFEDNAPYSVTDYSLVPVRVRGDSASVDAEFTVTSGSVVERLQRTQEFVCERGEWRVVMRPEQVAALTVEEDDAEDDADADSTREPDTETGDLDCEDFDYQEDAQAVYEQDTNDPNGLDGPVGEGYTGEQGEACENLPSRIATQSPAPAPKSQSPRPQPAPQPTPSPAPTPPSPAPTPPPQSAAPAPSTGDVDCSDFSSSAEAQGYLLPGDPYRLDADNDGQACDSLP